MKSMEINHKKLALQATLHCAIGCQIGELTGMLITTALGLNYVLKFAISIPLAFILGYSLTIFPMIRSGMILKRALTLTFATDTLSIISMEIGDNLSIFLIPGVLTSGIISVLYLSKLFLALIIGIVVALPVNYYLIKHGKGHAHHHSM